jgi:hypothetical protein
MQRSRTGSHCRVRLFALGDRWSGRPIRAHPAWRRVALYSRRHDTTVPARTEPRDTACGSPPFGSRSLAQRRECVRSGRICTGRWRPGGGGDGRPPRPPRGRRPRRDAPAVRLYGDRVTRGPGIRADPLTPGGHHHLGAVGPPRQVISTTRPADARYPSVGSGSSRYSAVSWNDAGSSTGSRCVNTVVDGTAARTRSSISSRSSWPC